MEPSDEADRLLHELSHSAQEWYDKRHVSYYTESLAAPIYKLRDVYFDEVVAVEAALDTQSEVSEDEQQRVLTMLIDSVRRDLPELASGRIEVSSAGIQPGSGYVLVLDEQSSEEGYLCVQLDGSEVIQGDIETYAIMPLPWNHDETALFAGETPLVTSADSNYWGLCVLLSDARAVTGDEVHEFEDNIVAVPVTDDRLAFGRIVHQWSEKISEGYHDVTYELRHALNDVILEIENTLNFEARNMSREELESFCRLSCGHVASMLEGMKLTVGSELRVSGTVQDVYDELKEIRNEEVILEGVTLQKEPLDQEGNTRWYLAYKMNRPVGAQGQYQSFILVPKDIELAAQYNDKNN